MGVGGLMEDDVESYQRAAAVEYPMVEPFFMDHVLFEEEINPAIDYKILESDQLKYTTRCNQHDQGYAWMIRVSYRRKKEIWEVRRYNSPHSCMQTSVGQDHGRLDFKVIAQYIFAM
ncbi:hypothetical protein PIB30_054679, partial [Stylosanthes scabra]|nr:hypothetical protein [Stylosanthes scabra]